MKTLPLAAVTILSMTAFGCTQQRSASGDAYYGDSAVAGQSGNVYDHPMGKTSRSGMTGGGMSGSGADGAESGGGNGAMATGAGSGDAVEDPTSFDSISRDLTPSLKSIVERDIDIDAHLAYMKDMNKRSFWSDLGRVFYTDHPSRLSPYPVVDLSAQPR